VQAIHRSSDDRPTLCFDNLRQLVSEGRFPDTVNAVYGDFDHLVFC
jgi:hypothetical protein